MPMLRIAKSEAEVPTTIVPCNHHLTALHIYLVMRKTKRLLSSLGSSIGILALCIRAYPPTSFFARRRMSASVIRPAFSQRVLEATKDAVTLDPIVDETTWNSYKELMGDIMSRVRVLKKQKTEEMKPVQDYLLSNQRLLDLPPLESSCNFRQRAKEQRERFLNVTGFSKEQSEYLCRCFTYMGDWCAKKQLPNLVSVTWYKMRESGSLPRENAVSTYMYVLSLSEDYLDTSFEVATFHDLLFEPNEKTITLRIKSHMSKGDATGAEDVLASLPDKGESAEWKKLRTFLPILSHYCEVGDMSSVLRLFRQMRQSDGVFLDTETYAMILVSLARRGYFRIGTPPIDGAASAGFPGQSGPDLLDDIAGEMADDLLELDEAAAKTIFDGFVAGFSDDTSNSCLDTEHVPNCTNFDGRLLIGRVSVNDTTAICPETGAKLRLFSLSEDQRQHVHDTLLEMAVTQHEEYGEKLKAKGKNRERRDGEYAYQQLSNFSEWLRNREGEPISAVVDGANVAYYGHGDVHYSQVKLVVDELERMGERPLVIMPQKYVAPSFWLPSLGFKQELSEREIEIMENMQDSGKLFVVPAHCLDDYYWMLGSVARQSESSLHVKTEDRGGRFPGLRPILITNDQMRDHKLALLEPRLFRRWTSCHIVNYDLRPYTGDEWEPRTIKFIPADVFSREIQGNKARGDEDSMAWHIPVAEWPRPDRLCINIKH